LFSIFTLCYRFHFTVKVQQVKWAIMLAVGGQKNNLIIQMIQLNLILTGLAAFCSVCLIFILDSRSFGLLGVSLLQLTRDHGDKGFLTRALGMDSHLEVDYQSYEVNLGDRYLLTSDGVHDGLTLAELMQCLSQEDDLAIAAEHVVELALAKGSQDNLSSLLLKVEALPHGDVHSLSTDLLQRVIPPVMAVGNRLGDVEVISVLHSGSRSHVYLVEQHSDDGTTNK
jgi:hypothetical protein